MLLYTIQLINGMTDAFSFLANTKQKHFLYLLLGPNNSNKMHGEPKIKTRGNLKCEKKGNVFFRSTITNGAESTIISNCWTENINSSLFLWNPLKCLCFGRVRVIKPSNTFSLSHLNFGIPLTMIADAATRSMWLQSMEIHIIFFVASEICLESKHNITNHNRFSIVNQYYVN